MIETHRSHRACRPFSSLWNRVSHGLAVVLAAASLLLSASADAAGPAEKKQALELVKLVTPRTTYDAMMKQVMDQMIAAVQAQGGKLPPGTPEKIKLAVGELVSYDEILDWAAEIYADRFTVGEMRDLIKFYQTPLGKKLARLLPEISGESAKKLGTMLPQRLPAALKKHGLAP
jgi:hypothetical protein